MNLTHPCPPFIPATKPLRFMLRRGGKMKLTYKGTLVKTRAQAVNLLEGRYINNNGIPPATKFSRSGNRCYGCKYRASRPIEERCRIGCPTRDIRSRMGEHGGCSITQDKDSLTLAINIIDRMLEEHNGT